MVKSGPLLNITGQLYFEHRLTGQISLWLSQFLLSIRSAVAVVLIAFTVVLCSLLPVNPAYGAEHDEPPNTVRTPTKSGQSHFVIAVSQNSYPFQFATPDGEPSGLMVDIWQLWAKKNGYTVSFELDTWARSVEHLKSNQVDFHAGMAITGARLNAFLLGQAIVSARTNIFIHQQINSVHTVSDLVPYVVGMVAGSSHIEALRKHLPGVNIRTYPTTAHLYRAALKGEVKAFAGLGRVSASHPDVDALSQMFPLYKKITDQAFDLTYAVNLHNPKLHQQIQNGLSKVSIEEINLIERHWLGIDSDSDTLVIAMPIDMAPYMSISAKGEPIGLFVDIWREWADKNRQKIVFLSDSSSLSMQNLIEGKADIHAAWADDAVNANLLAHAHHIYSFTSKIYYPTAALAEGDLQATLTDAALSEAALGDARLGILALNPAKKALKKRFGSAKLVLFNRRERMLEATLAGEIDGFVAAQEITNVHLIKNNLQSHFSAVSDVSFESKVYSLVAADNKELISQVKEGFGRVALNVLAELENAWIEHSDTPYFAQLKGKVELTKVEKNWVLRHPVIRLGALKDWAPIEFTDDNGQLIGVTADLVKIIKKRSRISVEVVLFDQWSQLLRALQNKEVDMVGSMEKTIARKDYALFTDGYWPSHWALILPTANSEIKSIAQLKGKRLAVTKGYEAIPYLNEHFPQTLLQIVKDHKSGFAAVKQGKADAFLEDMVTGARELKEGEHHDLGFSLVEDMEPALERFGIRLDWQPLVGILNKVIGTITPQEKKQILENWFEITIESGIDKVKVFQFGGAAILVVIVVLIWNRQLKAEVRLRREMEKKMQHMATHDELTGLPNRGLLKDRLDTAISYHARHKELIALLFIDLDGFKAVNDTYGHDIGDELLIHLSERLRLAIRKSDTASRCGGDEFVIILTGLHHHEEAVYLCEKILSVIKEPYILSACTAHVGASIGVAMYPEDGSNDEELLKIGDTLMYEVKGDGKDGYRFTKDKNDVGTA
ncbi:MAG: diguanylate cyclase (GGDEF)-like protein [Phenylobacterium sp.]|jgi:diguanylate cyclase (GGDEF)-like protein